MSSSSRPDRSRGVALLGSGGSIGRQALEVLAGLAPEWHVVALATGSRASLLEAQARQFRPRAVALGDETPLDLPAGTLRLHGDDALVEMVTRDDVDLVVVGTSGIVSLRAVLAALRAGKVVATANKETLVAGGHLVMAEARALAAANAAVDPGGPLARPLGWLRPIDSEHSAIWQCLAGEEMAGVAALVLTASGGPFLDTPAEAFAGITPAMALRHPTWSMGAKITIDSATLANKGLEMIEAHWLYDVDYAAIEVVIHPQSVVHSAVRFVDGSLKAQLGTPDMRLPIQYAITYPVPPAVARRRARPGGSRPAGVPVARRRAVPGPPDRPRGRAARVARQRGADRRGRRGRGAVPGRDAGLPGDRAPARGRRRALRDGSRAGAGVR